MLRKRQISLLFVLIITSAVLWGLAGCGRSSKPEFSVGAYYSVEAERGGFRVAKILAVDKKGVHIRLYQNRFAERPPEIAPDELTLGSPDDEGSGIEHAAVLLRTFTTWKPVFIVQGSVTEEELDGYKAWQESLGEYLGEES